MVDWDGFVRDLVNEYRSRGRSPIFPTLLLTLDIERRLIQPRVVNSGAGHTSGTALFAIPSGYVGQLTAYAVYNATSGTIRVGIKSGGVLSYINLAETATMVSTSDCKIDMKAGDELVAYHGGGASIEFTACYTLLPSPIRQ